MLNWPSYIAKYHLPKDDATNSGLGSYISTNSQDKPKNIPLYMY